MRKSLRASPGLALPDSISIVLWETSRILGVPLSQLRPQSTFVGNGGDSLTALQLQAALGAHGVQINIVSILRARRLIDLIVKPFSNDERLSEDNCHITRKVADVESTEPTAKNRRRSGSSKAASIKCSTCVRYSMTEMQVSLILSTKTTPGRNVIEYREVHRTENISALKAAWRKVIALEPIFRMSFEIGEFGGFIYEGTPPRFLWEEMTVNNESAYRYEVERPVVFDVSTGMTPTFRVITFDKGIVVDSISTVIWRVHHAMIDGASFALLIHKIRRIMAGEPVHPGMSFTAFTVQLNVLQTQGEQSATAFWEHLQKEHIGFSHPTTLLLPAPDEPDDTMGKVILRSDHEKLLASAQSTGVTVATLYYAAWGLVLSRYSDSDHVCFGAVLSGRSLPIDGVATVVGPTINTLPLCVSPDHGSTIECYVRQVFAALLDLTTFQYSTPSHGFFRNFSSVVNIRFDTPAWTGTQFDPIEPPSSRVTSDFPIHIQIERCGRIILEYSTKMFMDSHMARLGDSFVAALDGMLHPRSILASCFASLLDNQQRMTLARMGNSSSELSRVDSVTDDLAGLFAKAAEKYPTIIAVEYNNFEEALSYSQLHHQSSIVARQLTKFVSPGDIVGVHADGTINWIVAIYAILKSGATYLPLDQCLPEAARAANYTAAEAKLFLAGYSAVKSAKPVSCEVCLSVEELLQHQNLSEETRILPYADPSSIAYVCFTSGSTGRPKGIMCQHRGLVAFQRHFQVRLCSRPGWRVAQIMSPGFDGSIHEIFSVLSYGATLVLKNSSNPFDHLKTCNAAVLTPTVAQTLDPSEYPNLQAVYLVGEAVPQSVCDTWAPNRRLWNMYGPTETTCGATIKALVAKHPVTIGIPCPSMRIYLLSDHHKDVVPWGMIGEVCLAGIQVSAGYISRPQETARSFAADHVNPQHSDENMYRTGDRAYWNEEGELVFLGRNDRQIKLRGFRIDLDDLEIRLLRAYDKCIAVAVALDSRADGEHLVALVQPASLDMVEMRTQFRRQIPAYALPRCIMAVDTFPMTPSAKLDYKAIAATASSRPSDSAAHYEAALCRTATTRTSTGATVTRILKDVLGIPDNVEVDLSSSFSGLGGNSLLAITFKQRLSRLLQQHVPTGLILESPTIQDLAETLEQEISASPSSRRIRVENNNGIPQRILGEHSVSPTEKEWWRRYQVGTRYTSAFNVTYACQLPEKIVLKKLVSSWNAVLLRHRVLKCRYKESKDANSFQQVVREYAEDPPQARELPSIAIDDEVNIPFNLSDQDAELIRVLVSPGHMLVVMSHIICDLTTLQILLSEVANTYKGIDLPKIINKQYSQATTWSKPALISQLSFWSNYLAGTSNESSSWFPFDRVKPTSRKSWSGTSYLYEVPENAYQDLLRFASRHNITMHQLALAAVALALQSEDNEACDITLGAPYLNRDSEEELNIVGLFVEPLPIRIRYPEKPSVPSTGIGSSSELSVLETSSSSYLNAVRSSSRAALSNVVPWNQLLSHLGVQDPAYPSHPIFDVMVTFHEADHEVKFLIDGVQFRPTWAEGAKFKIMVEFTARSKGGLSIRVEYSDEFFTSDDVKLLMDLVLEALDGLAKGGSYGLVMNKLGAARKQHLGP